MAYVAFKGGKKAIEEAEKLVTYYRYKGGSTPIDVKQILDQMRMAVYQVMGEGSLYAPELAALALKQVEGDTLEASFLLRAFRSTLPRNLHSLPVDTTHMQVIRRISAAFKDIPGGQYLGPTRDYTKRLLNFKLMEEEEEHIKDFMTEYIAGIEDKIQELPPTFPKVIDLLRQEGLLEIPKRNKEGERKIVDDITRQSLRFPASRAMRLQSLARGETGSMMALAYSSMRGYGNIHPVIGELRVGYVDLVVPHILNEGETITVGKVMVTEVEIISEIMTNNEDKNKNKKPKFTAGYGLCFGQNEVKAIAMATLDRAMASENPKAPAEDEEFVLYHIDGIEASGFTSHFKLPHYVDFQAVLNRIRSVREQEEQEGRK
ncbi:carbon-phosphorus lyase complex subunit PhnI [Peptococcaceae bacterium]|nr:carbon-phosphorus lyase complex subunit PhnI [Peptococcaceae bacterium]